MRKKRIQFVLGMLVLGGLLGAWIFLKAGEKKESMSETTAQGLQGEENSQSDSTGNDTFGDLITENFQSICVKYGDERKTLEIQADGGKSHITDLDKNRVDDSVLEKVAQELENLSIARTLGEQADLIQYGLQTTAAGNLDAQKNAAVDDEISVVIIQKDGTRLQFQIGAAVTGRENSYYALQDGKVLILSSFPQELIEGRTAFYKKTLVSIPTQTDSEGYAADEFEYLNISGGTNDENIQIIPDEEAASGYLMIEPVRAEALLGETNADTGSISMYDLLGLLRAKKVKIEKYSEELLRDAGLADGAACKVSYSMNGEAHEIRIGKEEEDGYDLMLDEDPAMYLVSKEWAEKVLNLSVMDLRASYIWLVNLSDLDSVSVACGQSGKTWQIQEDGSAVCDGKIISKENFLPEYQELIGMTVLNVEKPEQVEGTPVLSITYHYKNFEDQREDKESHTVKVEIMPLETSDRYAAYLDGNFAGILRSDTVETVIQSWK